METGLSGKGVLITGASGGIGAACARAFAAEGARVAVHYHRGEERARAVAAELGGAPVLQADLTDEQEVDRLFEETRSALGQIDVCAAVAGVWPSADEPVWELSLERWELTLRQNLTSVFLTARGFLREVERTGHGIARARRLDCRDRRRGGARGLRGRQVGGARRAAPEPEERDRPRRAGARA